MIHVYLVNETCNFVQVLNSYESHWILVSKKNCKINKVNVYDSIYTEDIIKLEPNMPA